MRVGAEKLIAYCKPYRTWYNEDMEYKLFVDDTGFNKDKNSTRLNDEVATMVSCLIPADREQIVACEVGDQIDDLKMYYGADEFHFTDIYNRIKQFQGIDGDDVLSMIDVFADVVKAYDIKFVSQTITGKMLKSYPKLFAGLDKIADEINLPHTERERKESYALILNIIQAEKYVRSLDPVNRIAQVYVDEGIKKAGERAEISLDRKHFVPIYFASSVKNKLLQLADFGAWSLSRTKQSLDKANGGAMKDFERNVLYILSDIAHNYVNIDKISIDPNNVPSLDDFYGR